MEANNMKAMREALENIVGYAETARFHTEDVHILSFLGEIEGWARSALAAPPRNCDRFKTKEEAEIEFMMSDELPRNNGDTEMRAWMCRFIDWLLAPAAQLKGENDER